MIRAALLAACLGLAACGTVEGVGEDISDASRYVRNLM